MLAFAGLVGGSSTSPGLFVEAAGCGLAPLQGHVAPQQALVTPGGAPVLVVILRTRLHRNMVS